MGPEEPNHGYGADFAMATTKWQPFARHDASRAERPALGAQSLSTMQELSNRIAQITDEMRDSLTTTVEFMDAHGDRLFGISPEAERDDTAKHVPQGPGLVGELEMRVDELRLLQHHLIERVFRAAKRNCSLA